MASSAQKLTLLLLLTLSLSSLHIQARDSQFFNKIPGDSSNNVAKESDVIPKKDQQQPLHQQEQEDEEPSFVPQTENGGYGLYGHESGQLPPSTDSAPTESETFFNDKGLPENYNPVAYVTKPQGYSSESEYDSNNRNNDNYYSQSDKFNHKNIDPTRFSDIVNNNNNGKQVEVGESFGSHHKNIDSTRFSDRVNQNNGYNEYYNNGQNLEEGSHFGHDHKNISPTRFFNRINKNIGGDKYYNNGKELEDIDETESWSRDQSNNNVNGYYSGNNNNMFIGEGQGMSDTRNLENGRYFYNVNNNPNKRINYGNNKNSMEGYAQYNGDEFEALP